MQRSLIGFDENTVLSPLQHFWCWFGEGCTPYQSDYSHGRKTFQIFSDSPNGLRIKHLAAVVPTLAKVGSVSKSIPNLFNQLSAISARLKRPHFRRQNFIKHEARFVTIQPVKEPVQIVRQDKYRFLFLLTCLLFFRFLSDALKKLQSFP